MEEGQNHGVGRVGGAEEDVQAMRLRQAVRVRHSVLLPRTLLLLFLCVCVMIAVSRVRREPECSAATSLQGSLQISQALHLFFSAFAGSARLDSQCRAEYSTWCNEAEHSNVQSHLVLRQRRSECTCKRISGITYATFIYIYVYNVEENYVDIWKKCTCSLNDEESRNL
ncbi:hypothetical protein CBL_08576 [Carabus blaptoides fortunei]